MFPPSDQNFPNEFLPRHFNPEPRYVLFLTLIAAIFVSIFLYVISMHFPLFDYSDLSAAGSQITSGESLLGVNQDATGQFLWEASEPGDIGEIVSNCEVSHRFPPIILQWCDLITRYANKRGLPPDLVAALIWQESGGNPIAYSQSGAVGLMQVMPRDGLAGSFMCVNGPCFGNRPTIKELQDPEYNIAYGTRLLAGLLGRHGDLREALRYYGPKDVGYSYADKVFNLFHRYGEQSS
jgi:Transglycosylase SLT domain